ncbi:MAG: DUF805 domain-containing protein [Oscillospiraceae bacterium]
MSWYIKVIKNYFNFSGRARRKEYWMFALFNIIISFVLKMVDQGIGLSITQQVGVLSGIYGLFVMIPSLSLLFRRLHDVGKSAWWLLIVIIPVIGWIWLLVYTLMEGAAGDNQYGSNPKRG